MKVLEWQIVLCSSKAIMLSMYSTSKTESTILKLYVYVYGKKTNQVLKRY